MSDAPLSRPEQIGPYRVLDVLGEGGMGTVYLAEQKQPVRRRVALKIVKLGMDSKVVLARFEAERKALAMMEHSCIASVFDAGLTARGQPYFAMEYVKGIPITDYCDQNRLLLADRIRLFQKVCSGVQHAHLKGVMHRDLKPGNVLVTVQDGQALPKIIDFGLAKAVNHQLVEATIYTEQGVLIGTPEYMSPEQAGLGGLDIDTRTDVYSLGVLLYELLSGKLPFSREQLRQAGYLEMQRLIREQEPVKPSTKITTLGDGAGALAAARRVDRKDLWRALRGDLDWIVLRAMEKDRTRRYETAQEMAADLERHLRFEPVLASPPTFGYRASKFVRRYRAQVLTAAAIIVALAGGAMGTLWGYGEAKEQARLARENANQARESEVLATRRAQEAQAETQRADRAAAEATARADQIERDNYRANVQIAETFLRLGEVEAFRTRLEACPQSLRSWEWHWLNAQDTGIRRLPTSGDDRVEFGPDRVHILIGGSGMACSIWDLQSRSRVALRTPDGLTVDADGLKTRGGDWRAMRVQASVYSGDGTQVALSDGKSVTLWNVTGGSRLAAWDIDDELLALDRDGSRFVSVGEDLSIRIRDAVSGSCSMTLHGHTKGVAWAAFSPLDARLLTVGTDAAFLWDTDSGMFLARLGDDGRRVKAARFTADGQRIVTQATDTSLQLWDGMTGLLLANLPTAARYQLSGDGMRLALGNDAGVEVWDTASGRRSAVLKGHPAALLSLEFDASGTRMVTSCEDRTARVWDARTGDCLVTLTGLEAAAWFAGFAVGGSRVVTADRDRAVRLWDARTGDCLLKLPEHATKGGQAMLTHDGLSVATMSGEQVIVTDVTGGLCRDAVVAGPLTAEAFTDDASLVATVDGGAKVQVWDIASSACLANLAGHDREVTCLAFSRDAEHLATGSRDRTVRVWEPMLGACTTILRGHRSAVTCCAFAPDGTRVATGSADYTTRVWDVARGDCLVVLKGQLSTVWDVQWTRDGSRVVTASGDGTVRVWDAHGGDVQMELAGHKDRVNLLRVSADGARLVSASDDRTARIWDLRDGSCLNILDGHAGMVVATEFSPDGTRVVTASADQTARVWDAQTGACVSVLRGHDGGLESSQWQADGARIVTAGRDGTVRLWNPVDGQCLAILNQAAHSALFSQDGHLVLTSGKDGVQVHHSVDYRQRQAEHRRRGNLLEQMTQRVEQRLSAGTAPLEVRRALMADKKLTREQVTAGVSAVEAWQQRGLARPGAAGATATRK